MTVNSVSKVGHLDFGAGVVQVEAPRPAEGSTHVEPVQEGPKPSEAKPTPVMNGDVHLKFIVNEKTNDVTVLVLDRASRTVIRTIPTEELSNLSHGDLVEVFA